MGSPRLILLIALSVALPAASALHCGGTACRGQTNELNTEYVQASMNGMDRYVQRALDRGAHRYYRSAANMGNFGANPTEKKILGTGGCTAMHMAAFFGHLSTVRLLLKNDFDLREASAIDAEQSDSGGTPLMLAAAKGHAAILGALLHHGAEVRTQDHDGKTAEDYAASEDIISLLKGATKIETVYTPDPVAAPKPQPPCVHQEGGCSDEEQKAWDDAELLRSAGEHVHGHYYPVDGKMMEFNSETGKYTPVLDEDGDQLMADDVLDQGVAASAAEGTAAAKAAAPSEEAAAAAAPAAEQAHEEL